MKKSTVKSYMPKDCVADTDDSRRWKIEDGLRTIARAKEIEKDKSLLKDIKALAKKQADDLAAIGKK